ncbi:F510_1955 family glycosylhydrolase [Pseudarthrobacter cellobiosi]|uniref:F510_1955 family glycosylhydrolase n=1 Tax=Pseudarthrobacter cellobiosi TaxID=2953654 RepID=UPI00208F5A86|nr:exo-alpha-sialidase [Pseudarthrobacter sp. HLT1-5]MCO4254490.1 exo-alpha-sialidase [Pseudarthrobacter sp. HLT1-5]
MFRIRSAAFVTAGTILVLALSACLPASGPTEPTQTSSAASGLPSAHIHGLTVNGETDQVLLATHDGLFDVTKEPAVKIGATNDLMGFTSGKDQGVYYASGHPGKGSNLPNPLGLVRSTDGGKTWEQLSRQGESDFHALTVSKSGIVAFDGTLRTSPDGKTWTTVAADFSPAVLAGNPTSDTVLATTPDGLRRATDGGATWTLDPSAPVIQFAAFATPTEAVGVQPDGAVHHSADGGATWTPKGRITGEVQAITAAKDSDGKLRIWAATADGILTSTDGGETFRDSDPK